jgi:hypothetical protein
MTSISTNNRLFQDANQAAEIYVKGCVRSVLRQVALESIQQNLIISDDNNLLTVTLLHVHDAQDLCKLVANTWMEKLLAIGHVQAASWLDEVVADGNEDLYYQNGTKNGLRQQRTATKRQDLAADLTGNEAEKTKHAMGTQLTTVSRLRSLGAETIWRSLDKDSSSSIDLVAAIHTLDEWARTNQTDWPYGSRIIHKCSQALSSRVAVSKQDEIEIIPKSLWEKQQQQQQPGEEDPTPQRILDRKRKSRPRPFVDDTSRRSIHRSESPPPRPPNDAEDWNQRTIVWTNDEQANLDRYLHDSDNSTATSTRIDATLMGGLVEFGRIQYYYDWSSNNTNNTSTDYRIHKRRAAQERLGPHQKQSTNKAHSCVLTTVHPRNQQCSFELDLTTSLMQLGTSNNEKQLYCFSSIEAVLLDEDDDKAIEENSSTRSI